MQQDFVFTILVYSLPMVLQLQSKTDTLNSCIDVLDSFFFRYLRNTMETPHLKLLILNGYQQLFPQ
jgi:hypothetical protein